MDQGPDPGLAGRDDLPQQRMPSAAQPRKDLLRQVSGLVADLPEVLRPGQHARHRDRGHEYQQVAAAPPLPRVRPGKKGHGNTYPLLSTLPPRTPAATAAPILTCGYPWCRRRAGRSRAALPRRHPARRAVSRRDSQDRHPDQGICHRALDPCPACLPLQLVSVAPPPPGSRPLAPLQHPPRSPRHPISARRKVVTLTERLSGWITYAHGKL
jgi:hypothetical protein